MDATFIDAKKKLGPKAIQDFLQNLTDDANVSMLITDVKIDENSTGDFVFEKKVSDFRQFFEDDNIETSVNNDDNCIINFICESKVLEIIGLDYNWWIAVVRGKKRRRLEKLFGTESKSESKEQKQKSKQDDSVIKCASALITSDDIPNAVIEIQSRIEANKKEVVNFLNKQYQLLSIRTMFKGYIVFCLNYQSDEDLTILENWKTLDELKAEGSIQ